MIKEEINVQDLKPQNTKYSPDNFDNDDRTDLRKSMLKTYKEIGYPNTEICLIDKNNIVYSGNRRWHSATEEELPKLRCTRTKHTFDEKCLTDPVLYKKELDILSDLNYPGTKRNELAWEVVLTKYDQYNKVDEKITGKPYSNKQRNYWCLQNTKYSPDNFKKMVEIYEEGRLDLIKKVDLDDVSVNDAYKEAMNIQPKAKLEYDPDRKNWIQHIKDNPEVGKRIVRYANDMFNYKLNYSMKNIHGKVINNLPEHPTHGHEQNMLSTNLSNDYMSAVSIVLEEEGFDSITPREEAGLPDIRILNLSKEGYHPERIEVKVAKFNGHGSKTYISAGPGATRIVPHTFLLVVYDPKTKRQMAVLSDLIKEDWKSDARGKKCEMGMNVWADSHIDDCVFLCGDGFIDTNNVFQIEMHKVKGGE
jgi:hypothetical protein